MEFLSPKVWVTKKRIVEGLRDLGVTPGLGVMVHSSLKSFGPVDGGAQTVVDALMEAVTPQGTLMMPSFNHGVPFKRGGPGYYDPSQTPTINGAIPECFWRQPGVSRSLDPTHPIAAWGKNSREYTAHHHRTLTMGPQSPLGRLCADEGYGLLLGVSYAANTFHHVVEMSTGAPCLGQRSESYRVLLPDGRKVMGRTWGWREAACPINDDHIYDVEMAKRGLQRQVLIGGCKATLFRLKDCFEVIASLLQTGKGSFPPCRGCPIRPRRTPRTVASDWDPQAQSLLPDSEAWQY